MNELGGWIFAVAFIIALSAASYWIGFDDGRKAEEGRRK